MSNEKKDFKLFTKKGYDFFEVSSAFQKSVRRNKEEDACYWAQELYNTGYDKYLWKRILIITSEDVGIAEPMMPATIKALHDTYFQLKNEKTGDQIRLMLFHAVILLCRAKKSRICDWSKNYFFHKHDTHNLEIPDYALDVHTRKGKSKGRGIQYFHDEGSKVEPFAPVEFEKERKEWHEKFFQLSEEERQAQQNCKTLPGFVFPESQKNFNSKSDDNSQAKLF